MPTLQAPPASPRLLDAPKPAAPAPALAAPAGAAAQPYKGDWIALILWLAGALVISAMLLKDLVWGLLRLW